MNSTRLANLSIILLLLSCTIVIKPSLSVIDAADTLEKQILGEFKIIETNYLYMEKPSQKVTAAVTEEERTFFVAVKNRIYFEDIIERYKQMGYIGEGEDGKLHILRDKVRTEHLHLLEEMEKAVDVDNFSREKIINYVVKKNNDEGNRQIYWDTFFKIQEKKANSGTFIEREGAWIIKK